MITEESKIIAEKIKELQAIYNEFVKKLDELRSRRSSIINNIIKRIEHKKVQENLDKLNKIK